MMASQRGIRKDSNWVLMNTVFMGFKKGLLPCEPHLVEASLKKHKVALTKDPSLSDSNIDKVERYCQQIFRDFHVGKSFPDTMNQSTHSTSVSSYAEGGNVGFVRRYMYGDDPSSFIGDPQLLGFVCLKGKAVHFPVPVYQRNPVSLADILETFNNVIFQPRDWTREFCESKLRDDCCLEAVPACILEPMKVRLITKPGLGLHVRMHKLQKSLRSFYALRYSDMFALTGEPLRRDHLWPIIGRGFALGEGMVSADFSAATDNLKGDLTQAIIRFGFGDEVFRYDPILYENLTNTLRGVEVLQERAVLPKYGNILDNYEYELSNFQQVNGQLMGHVISFLILCVANLCSYWDSWERYLGTELSLEQLRKRHPCLINGDDLLFKSNKDHYSIWWNVIQEYGLSPSVGKNFFSDRFLQINSELWKIDTRLAQGENPWVSELVDLRKIHYVNFGLITNRKKQDCTIDATLRTSEGISGLETLEGRLAAMPDIRQKLFDGLPEVICQRANAIFERHCYPVFQYFGLHSNNIFFGNRWFENEFRLCFSSGTSPDLRYRVALGDLSASLVREPLELHKGRINNLFRRIRKNPGLLQGPFPLETYGPMEKEDWVSVLETPNPLRHKVLGVDEINADFGSISEQQDGESPSNVGKEDDISYDELSLDERYEVMKFIMGFA